MCYCAGISALPDTTDLNSQKQTVLLEWLDIHLALEASKRVGEVHTVVEKWKRDVAWICAIGNCYCLNRGTWTR